MNTTHLLRRLAMPKVAGVGAQLMTAATCAVLVLSSMLGPTAALAESRVPIGSTQDSMIEPANPPWPTSSLPRASPGVPS
ncbi:MAG: hypothetical protein WA991_09065 [Ornithinimicrobium sp.]